METVASRACTHYVVFPSNYPHDIEDNISIISTLEAFQKTLYPLFNFLTKKLHGCIVRPMLISAMSLLYELCVSGTRTYVLQII